MFRPKSVLFLVVWFMAAVAADWPGIQAKTEREWRQAYQAAGEVKKISVLEAMLEEGSREAHLAFYGLLEEQQYKEDIIPFGLAFSGIATCRSLTGLFDYIEALTKAHSGAGAASGNPTIQATLQSLQASLDAMTHHFLAVIRRNTSCLTAELKGTTYQPENAMRLSFLGWLLSHLRDEGLEALFASVQKEKDIKPVAHVALESYFMPFLVEPVLKLYENPASTENQRILASVLIKLFPEEEAVYDQIVSALRHGNYFPSSGNLFEQMRRAWRLALIERYKGKGALVRYIGEHYLAVAEGRDSLFYFLMEVDRQAAMAQFFGLNLGDLDTETLKTLTLATVEPPPPEPSLHDERYRLFVKFSAS